MQQLPIGIQNFEMIFDQNLYFVDKSMLIGHIIDNGFGGTYLYTRPRRFGKSVNLSMIDAFFNIQYKNNIWFDDLEISEHPEYTKYKNAFPVIHLDLRPTGDDYKTFFDSMNRHYSVISRQFRYLAKSEELDDEDRKLFDKIYKKQLSESESRHAIEDLSRMLHAHHKTKVMILIDEYDGPMNRFHGTSDYDKILGYIRDITSFSLKGNDSLQLGIITGVMQIAKESIFSGLNNLRVNNILSEEFDEMYGFTEEEVKKIFVDCEHPEKYDECRTWYDGYRFGNTDVYDPWSVLNYVKHKFKTGEYWTGTSGNDIIPTLIDNANEEIMGELGALLSGQEIQYDISPVVTMDDIDANPHSIFSVMAMSGYLTVHNKNDGHWLSIPNKEMYIVFSKMLFNGKEKLSKMTNRFTSSLLKNEIEPLKTSLKCLLNELMSIRILDNEREYQSFIAGLLATLLGQYSISVDKESGNGYHDVMLRANAPNRMNVVIELKRAKSESEAKTCADNALTQIKEKKYTMGLKGKTILYGIAFVGKEPYIVSEIADLG